MLADAAAPLKETPLTRHHRALGARMVAFAGYSMPLQYAAGIVAEHQWTRAHAGLFDVSHMGPSFLVLVDRPGDDEADHAEVAAIVEALTPSDIRGLTPGRMRYTVLLNDDGGILDDLLVARPADPASSGALYIVVNAATKDSDFALIGEAAAGRAHLRRSDESALLALQGPKAADVVAAVVPAAVDLGFMSYGSFEFASTRLVISRSGYTGEDGFELLVPHDRADALWRRLLDDERVRPAGLGARDTLRLEAGLPLYGHDLDATVSPVEAGLAFTVSRRRRETADFPGAHRILAELSREPARVRVGLLVDGAPAREGTVIMDDGGAPIGTVTSGGFSPTLGRPVAMGYVPPRLSATGTMLKVSVRDRVQPATVTALPFVPHRYFRKQVS